MTKNFGSPAISVVFTKYGHKTNQGDKFFGTTKKLEKWSFSVLKPTFQGMF